MAALIIRLLIRLAAMMAMPRASVTSSADVLGNRPADGQPKIDVHHTCVTRMPSLYGCSVSCGSNSAGWDSGSSQRSWECGEESGRHAGLEMSC
jgi:hypothetical protein